MFVSLKNVMLFETQEQLLHNIILQNLDDASDQPSTSGAIVVFTEPMRPRNTGTKEVCIVHKRGISGDFTKLSVSRLQNIQKHAKMKTCIQPDDCYDLKDISELNISHVPENYGYHRNCYRWFSKQSESPRKRPSSDDITHESPSKMMTRSESSNRSFSRACLVCNSPNPKKVKSKYRSCESLKNVTSYVDDLNPLLHAIRNNGIRFFSFWNSKENVSNKVIPKKNFLICCK